MSKENQQSRDTIGDEYSNQRGKKKSECEEKFLHLPNQTYKTKLSELLNFGQTGTHNSSIEKECFTASKSHSMEEMYAQKLSDDASVTFCIEDPEMSNGPLTSTPLSPIFNGKRRSNLMDKLEYDSRKNVSFKSLSEGDSLEDPMGVLACDSDKGHKEERIDKETSMAGDDWRSFINIGKPPVDILPMKRKEASIMEVSNKMTMPKRYA